MILPAHAPTISVAGFSRIADTLDAVPYVTMCNLANLNAALRGGVLDLIEVRLLAVGGGPTLDYADAAAFLAGFETDDREGAQAAAAMRRRAAPMERLDAPAASRLRYD